MPPSEPARLEDFVRAAAVGRRDDGLNCAGASVANEVAAATESMIAIESTGDRVMAEAFLGND